jgi:hypothetical protein
MKRYEVYYGIMTEFPEGEWVKYKDIKFYLETKPPEINIKSIECNCVEKADEKEKPMSCFGTPLGISYDISWICPAHGYKRL